MRCALIFFAALAMAGALATDPSEDQQMLDRAAASRPQSLPAAPAPPVEPTSDDELAQLEQEARVDATIAVMRLELVKSRRALRDGQYEDAARRANRVLSLIAQLPTDVDASVQELQAEGILAKAARAGVDVAALRREVAEEQPAVELPADDDPALPAKTRAAARLARSYDGPDTPDVDTSGNERLLRERALRRGAADHYGYRPVREIVDTDALDVRDAERVYYQAALEGAYKDSETQALIEAQEARVIPGDIVTYPQDWPERMKKREQYAGGMIARSPSWRDKDGREWYVAIYDIHDLIYVPPDFDGETFNPLARTRETLDREALRQHNWIFRGTPEDLAAGIPLLRYFGGVNAWALRGPKYSLARQQQVVDMIQAFAGSEEGAKIIPLAP
jgi:hypothetical protein